MSSERPLRPPEIQVLGMVRAIWGPQNTDDLVTFSVEGEAQLWVVDRNGQVTMFLSVTGLAEMHQDGTLSTVELIDWVKGPLGARA